MADLKISQLNSIVTVVPATDVLPVVQGGTTLKITPNQILGAGGTATLASATITGDLTVDTNTLKVDSTNNRLGIGTTTPAYKLEVATGTSGQQALASFRTADTTAANNAGIQIYATPSSTAASRSVLLSLDADGADASGGDYFIIQKLGNSGQVDLNQQSNAAMTFSTNGTERYRIASDGVATWSNVGGVAGTAMTLNSTGLNVVGRVAIGGASLTYPLNVRASSSNIGNTAFLFEQLDGTPILTMRDNGTVIVAGDIRPGNTVNTVSPTSPNRTITMIVGGVTLYIPAKTTND